MKSWFIYPILALFGTALLAAVLIFYPPKVVLPYLQRVFLPRAAERTEPVAVTIEKDTSATFIFTGDIMMARDVEGYIKAKGQEYPFANIGDTLLGADLVIGNFEGTIRDKEHIEGINEMSFDTTSGNVEILRSAGFGLLSLANNHADDFGPSVTAYTRKTIEDAGIATFGDANDSKDFVTRKTINGRTFSFIGYHAFGETAESLIDAIKAEETAGNFIIMFPHWGVEYERDPSSSQVAAAHMFVDAGADAVIGAHPHVIETTEIYKNAPIVYSLGNFLFDQSWSVPTMIGLTAKMTVTDATVSITFTPIFIEKRQMAPANEKIKESALEALGLPSGSLLVNLP